MQQPVRFMENQHHVRVLVRTSVRCWRVDAPFVSAGLSRDRFLVPTFIRKSKLRTQFRTCASYAIDPAHAFDMAVAA
jgi:hypothetical protein